MKNDRGQAMRHAYCDVWRFREGLMAGLRAYGVELGPAPGTGPSA